jgi:hypothetical protein
VVASRDSILIEAREETGECASGEGGDSRAAGATRAKVTGPGIKTGLVHVRSFACSSLALIPSA